MRRTSPSPAAAVTAPAILAALLIAGCAPGRSAEDGRGSTPRPVSVFAAGEVRRSEEAGAEPFHVAETGPSGTIPHEYLAGGVWVLFNRPVVSGGTGKAGVLLDGCCP